MPATPVSTHGRGRLPAPLPPPVPPQVSTAPTPPSCDRTPPTPRPDPASPPLPRLRLTRSWHRRPTRHGHTGLRALRLSQTMPRPPWYRTTDTNCPSRPSRWPPSSIAVWWLRRALRTVEGLASSSASPTSPCPTTRTRPASSIWWSLGPTTPDPS